MSVGCQGNFMCGMFVYWSSVSLIEDWCVHNPCSEIKMVATSRWLGKVW